MSGQHQAAAALSSGQPLKVIDRDTPEPGPEEILIEVKAVAMNPVDYYQRDRGMPPVSIYPAVFGSDTSGVVVKAGGNVPNPPTPGTRVMAFASSFYQKGSPDHGAFQERTLARYEGVMPIPDSLSFEEAAILPLGVLTALSAYTTLDIPIETKLKPEDKQGFLVWGASSSVGSYAVQSAKVLGYTVYATAGAKNLEYVKKLGADAVFDYKVGDVVQQIANRAKADGVDLRTAHVIVDNALQQTLDVLKLTKGEKSAKVAHAPLLPEDAPSLENTEIKFTYTPLDEDARNKHIFNVFHNWLKTNMESGSVVASPRIQVIGEGVENVNKALDTLKAGVSGTKLVVKV